MALHFPQAEYDARLDCVKSAMAERKLDALLLFSQESMYWLTGYDSFGFVFFQCLVVTRSGRMALLTRAADLRQARHTSTLEEIVLWTDRAGADPAKALKEHLFELDLLGARLGVEYDTPGLTAANGRLLDNQLRAFATLENASDVFPGLMAVKRPAEIAFVRKAARLADEAHSAGLAGIRAGADEGAILAAMQGAVLTAGGDYPANEFVIGSGRDALLCRSHTGRRTLDPDDQITLEFAGVWRRYHAAMMETVVVGTPRPRHEALFAAADEALAAAVSVMRPGHTFGAVFDAHARVVHDHGMTTHRLNACGYSLGAAFGPSWMQWPMFYQGNQATIVPDMVLFAHIILMDSETQTAMTLGRTFLTTDEAPEPLSSHPPSLLCR